jgi:DNA-binding SARP family transcriptional activator/energy-coupling factor transporter ATP-binding protein EcfA2
VEFGILGPLSIRDGGVSRMLAASRQRIVLAALLLRAREVVTTDELIGLLWENDPPKEALGSLRNHVMRLRQALGGGCGQALIRTASCGYLIDVHESDFDVAKFTRLQRQGTAAMREGQWSRSADDFRAALALWRGEALVDVPSALLHRDYHFRLTEARLQTVEWRIEADLQLGRHNDLIGEMRHLVADHPLREHFHAQAMLALYRAGRRAEALAAYRHARRLLVSELGISPGAELQDLHARMLKADPMLDLPRPAPMMMTAPARVAPSVLPRQSPPDIAFFTGRKQSVEFVVNALSQTYDRETATAVCAITGTAGVGKTTLTVHVAHLLHERFPDGQLYASLDGPDLEPKRPTDLMARFLRDLGVENGAVPAEREERQALFRSLTADRRILLVLDGAHDAAQVRPLLLSSGRSAVLITSRNKLPGLNGVSRLDLDVFDHAEARELFERVIGPDRVAPETGALNAVIEACGRLPLALQIVAARLAVRPDWKVSDLAHRLADHRRRLDELSVEDLRLRAVFQLSFRALSQSLADAFCMLALLDVKELTSFAAAGLLGCTESEAEEAAETLVNMSLLTSRGPGLYHYHDLLRAFAREKAGCSTSIPDHATVFQRALTRYRKASSAANLAIRSGPGPRQDGQFRFTDATQARLWFDYHHESAVALIVQTCEQPKPDLADAADLLRNIGWALRACGHWAAWERASRAVLDAATAADDPDVEVLARQHLGMIAILRGRFGEAHAALHEALTLARHIRDRCAEANALNRLGLLCHAQGRDAEAVENHAQARRIFAELGDDRGATIALINLGKCRLILGDPDAALADLRAALDIARDTSDQDNTIVLLHHIACCQTKLGMHADAISTHRDGLATTRANGYREGEAYTLAELGNALLAAGDPPGAIEHLDAAIDLFHTLGDPSAVAHYSEILNRARLLGHARR